MITDNIIIDVLLLWYLPSYVMSIITQRLVEGKVTARDLIQFIFLSVLGWVVMLAAFSAIWNYEAKKDSTDPLDRKLF